MQKHNHEKVWYPEWHSIDWRVCREYVEKQQSRIVEAMESKDLGKVSRLQNNLVNSWAARAIAVRHVASNKGKLA